MKTNYFFLLLFFMTYFVSAQLVLNEVAFDVAPSTTSHGGDNNGDGIRSPSEDEFLEFVNIGGTPIDISGYQIFDSGDVVIPKHIVPEATIIPSGGIYIVFGGGDVSAINNLSGVIAHTATSGGLSAGDNGEIMTVKDATNVTLITFDGATAQWDGSEDQSIARSPSVTGDFIYHQFADGTRHSAGVLQAGPIANTFPLVLNEIHSDPDLTLGDANADTTIDTAQDEFLEFFNNSGSSVDITGYKLYDFTAFNDATSPTPVHLFPSTVIPSNGALVVFGGGTPTGTFGNATVQTATAAGSFLLSLGNAGDAIIITDASDNIVYILNYNDLGVDFGDNQSVTRDPDITGNFVLHTTTTGSLRYSPGLKIDGSVLNVDAFNELEVSIYPNPVNNSVLNIKTGFQGEKNIELTDLNGRNILKTQLSSDVLDVSSVNRGLYILKVSIDNNYNISKILIK